MKEYVLLVLIILMSFSTYGQTIFGKWRTFDDETGEEKSIVHIYEINGKVYGKIIDIKNENNKTSLCEKCKGNKHNKPVLGMVIIDGLTKKDDTYQGGKILDPENGKEYICKIWFDSNSSNILNVRGYIAFFYRTQYWKRIEN